MQIARLLSGFVLLSSLLLQSCQQEPLRITAEEEYIREFYKTFKNVDPDHDWNLAQKSTVTVKTSVPSSIRVLADVKGTRYLFADYKDAQGTTEIPVTLPKGISDIIVSVNGQKFPSTLGATVDATSAKSRIIESGSNNGLLESWGEAPLRYFPASWIGDAMDVVPEEKDNIEREKIITDFSFVSEAGKPVTIYPVFWNTSSSHVLGVYWLNEDGSFPWCKNEDQLNTQDVKAELSFANMQDLYYTRSGELNYCKNYSEDADQATLKWQRTVGNCSYPHYFGVDENGSIQSDYRPLPGTFRTKGITFTFSKSGINFGFYIKVKDKGDDKDNPIIIPNQNGVDETRYPKKTLERPADGGHCTDFDHIIFSHTRRNKNYGRVIYKDNKYVPSTPLTNPDDKISGDYGKSTNYYIWGTPWNGQTDLKKYVGASFFETTNRDGVKLTFFAFEDWRNTPDLNDLIFLLDAEVTTIDEETGDEIKPEEPKPYTWIIAAEDLGGSFDWDFNDLVAEIQLLPVSENDKEYTKVTVKPLASGGFRPVYLMYTGKKYDVENDTEIDVKDYVVGGEFHSLFGGNHGTPTNVSKGSKKTAGDIVFYTPKGHTMAKPHVQYDKENPNMGGFWVLSCEENKPLSGISANEALQEIKTIPEGQGINQVGAPDSNKEPTSPQIMCLEAGWRWPLENKDIRHAYTTFETWVTDQNKTEWVNTYNEEHLIDKY